MPCNKDQRFVRVRHTRIGWGVYDRSTDLIAFWGPGPAYRVEATYAMERLRDRPGDVPVYLWDGPTTLTSIHGEFTEGREVVRWAV